MVDSGLRKLSMTKLLRKFFMKLSGAASTEPPARRWCLTRHSPAPAGMVECGYGDRNPPDSGRRGVPPPINRPASPCPAGRWAAVLSSLLLVPGGVWAASAASHRPPASPLPPDGRNIPAASLPHPDGQNVPAASPPHPDGRGGLARRVPARPGSRAEVRPARPTVPSLRSAPGTRRSGKTGNPIPRSRPARRTGRTGARARTTGQRPSAARSGNGGKF